MRDDHSADAGPPQPLVPDDTAPAIGLQYVAAFCVMGLLIVGLLLLGRNWTAVVGAVVLVAGVVGRAGPLGR